MNSFLDVNIWDEGIRSDNNELLHRVSETELLQLKDIIIEQVFGGFRNVLQLILSTNSNCNVPYIKQMKLNKFLTNCIDDEPIFAAENEAKQIDETVTDLFNFDISYNFYVPFHDHYDSPYIARGCKQCIKQKQIPSHNTHASGSKYAVQGCERCLKSLCDEKIEIDLEWLPFVEENQEEDILHNWEFYREVDTKKQTLLGFGYVRMITEHEYASCYGYNIPNCVKMIIGSYFPIFDGTSNKRNRLSTLILTLPNIFVNCKDLNSRWKPIGNNKLLNGILLKKAYYKCVRFVHPDKSIARGDDIRAQHICRYAFMALEQAFNTHKWNNEMK